MCFKMMQHQQQQDDYDWREELNLLFRKQRISTMEGGVGLGCWKMMRWLMNRRKLA